MIRILNEKDTAIWKAMWLEALHNHPRAFAESYNEALQRSDSEWEKNLKDGNPIFGFFDGDEMIGCIAYYTLKGNRRRHRAEVYAVYVKPPHRGKGIMQQLLRALSEHAMAQGIEQLHLDVDTESPDAIRCYERGGFVPHGTKPHTLKVGERYIDTHMMVKHL